MFSVVTKLFLTKQVKFEEGRLELMGIRDCFTPLDTYMEIQKNLVSRGKSDMIYQSSKKASFEWLRKLGSLFNGLTQSKAISLGIDIIELSGWGQLYLEKVDFNKKIAFFKVVDSTLARKYGNSAKPVDYMMRGLLAGGLGFIMKEDLDCYETECAASGADVCRFVVGKKDEIQSFLK
jgi:predicted hydrocarbon binding protein